MLSDEEKSNLVQQYYSTNMSVTELVAEVERTVLAKVSQQVQGDFHQSVSVWYAKLTGCDGVQDEGEHVGYCCPMKMMDELECIIASANAVPAPNQGYNRDFDEVFGVELSVYGAPPQAAAIPESWRLTKSGQIKVGDVISMVMAGRRICTSAKEVLNAGTDKEEIVYNRKKNHYFITSMVLNGTSNHKEVFIIPADSLSAAPKPEGE
jgi:hypothetical protein